MLLETLKNYKKEIKEKGLNNNDIKKGLYEIIARDYYKYNKEELKELVLDLLCCSDDIEMAINDYIERTTF